MKKAIPLLVATILLLTSCSLGDTYMFGKIFRSDREIANESFEKIIRAIESRDKNALTNLFSERSIADSDDFDGSITALFDYYKGEMTSYNDWGGPNTNDGINDDGTGRNWKNIQSTYDVETNGGIYRFAIKTFLKDSADANNIGVYSLYVMRVEDSDIRFAYWGDGNWTPGINIDEAKE